MRSDDIFFKTSTFYYKIMRQLKKKKSFKKKRPFPIHNLGRKNCKYVTLKNGMINFLEQLFNLPLGLLPQPAAFEPIWQSREAVQEPRTSDVPTVMVTDHVIGTG